MAARLVETILRDVFHCVYDQHIDHGVKVAVGFFKNL